jgi:rare lipoprotein A
MLGAIADTLAGFVRQTLAPTKATAKAEQAPVVSQKGGLGALGVRQPVADPVRDAPGELVTVALGPARPAPAPAPEPGSPAPLGAAAAMTGATLPVAKRVPVVPSTAEVDALLQQMAGGTLGTAAMGQDSDPPRVFEDAYVVLLQPVPGKDGIGSHQAEPVRVTCSLYSTVRQVQVEVRFSEPIQPSLLGCEGNWTIWEVPGYRVAEEQSGSLGPDGFMNLHVRTLPGGGKTRFGFALKGVGRMPFGRLADPEVDGSQVLLATAARPASLDTAPVKAPSTDGGGYALDVVKSFSGRASWYGGRFHGRRTASGERFDKFDMTAAHRSLRLGTYVRVTNLANGREVILKVNDRGPFVGGRVLDVSYGAAVALGFIGQGTARVQVEVLASN